LLVETQVVAAIETVQDPLNCFPVSCIPAACSFKYSS
jgi:hypothetical protein